MPCDHGRLRAIASIQHPPEPGQPYRLTVAATCDGCGAVFEFVKDETGIAFNDERTALTAWIVEKPPEREP
jgi:hypothetical protein